MAELIIAALQMSTHTADSATSASAKVEGDKARVVSYMMNTTKSELSDCFSLSPGLPIP